MELFCESVAQLASGIAHGPTATVAIVVRVVDGAEVVEHRFEGPIDEGLARRIARDLHDVLDPVTGTWVIPVTTMADGPTFATYPARKSHRRWQ